MLLDARKIAIVLLLLAVEVIVPGLSSPCLSQAIRGPFSLASPLTLNWKFNTSDTINVTPATDGRHVYLPVSSGGLIAIEARSGKLVWRENIGGEVSADPVSDGSAVFVANEILGSGGGPSTASGAIRALSRESGVTLWLRTLPFPISGGILLDHDVLYGASSDGRVFALRKDTGEAVWTARVSVSFRSHPSSDASNLYLGSEEGTVYAFDKGTGSVKWRYRTQGPVRGRTVNLQGIVVFGSGDGYVYAINAKTGKRRWGAKTGAAVQSVTFSEGGIVAASLDNFVYGFTLFGGGRIWKRLLAGRPISEPLVLGRSVLFNSLAGSGGVVLDGKDGKVVNSLPIGADNSCAAAPVLAGDVVLITTREGLLAFAPPNGN